MFPNLIMFETFQWYSPDGDHETLTVKRTGAMMLVAVPGEDKFHYIEGDQ